MRHWLARQFLPTAFWAIADFGRKQNVDAVECNDGVIESGLLAYTTEAILLDLAVSHQVDPL